MKSFKESLFILIAATLAAGFFLLFALLLIDFFLS